MSDSAGLLDTTMLVDWFKIPHRQVRIRELMREFGWTFTTDIALLEFKAVLIQQLITIHNKLRQLQQFTVARDTICESSHPQSRLRGHIFTNLINIRPNPHSITELENARYADKARLRIKAIVPRLFEEVQTIATQVQRRIKCDRSVEAPRYRTTTFDVTLPRCVRGENKNCGVEEFIRSAVVPRLVELEAIVKSADSSQVASACELFKRVQNEADIDLSSSDCRRAGDCMIAIGAEGQATHALSTNAREWEPLAKMIGAEFVRVTYPVESGS
jgi:hypothetical protein